MSRDSGGTYTLPAGNPVVTGTTIDASWANPTLTDLATGITNSLSRNGQGGMLSPLLGPDGTVSNPQIAFTDAPSTGIYRAGTGDLRVSIVGVDTLRIKAGEAALWDVTTSTWFNLITSENTGGTLETITLTAAQTIVPFTANIAGASIFYNAAAGARGRLLETDDYTYNGATNEITLIVAATVNDKITAVYNDESDVAAAATAAQASAAASAVSAAAALVSEGAAAASESAAAASETASAASAVAAAASAATVNLPAITPGDAGKSLIVNVGETGYDLENIDLTTIEANIALNAFNIAVNGGSSVHHMVDGVSDVFTDETGIATGRSINETYDGTGNFYEPATTPSVYSGESFSMVASNPMSLAFNADGTKFFVLMNTSDTIYEYTCSVGFDLSSTVAASGNTFSVTSEETDPRGMSFNTDGTKFFVVGWTNDTVFEYTCSTGFDLGSTVAYSGNSFSIAAQETSPYGLDFNADGTKFFMFGSAGTVFEYTCSVGFDLSSTVAYSGNSVSTSAQGSAAHDLVFNADGTKFFKMGVDDTVYEYTCSVGFDLTSTVTYTGDSLSTNAQDTNMNGLAFSADGTKFFTTGIIADDIFEYDAAEVFSLTQPLAMALETDTFTALASPDSAYIVLHEEDIDAVTLNTDLSAWVSRTTPLVYTTAFATDNKLTSATHGFTNDDRVILSSSTGTNFPAGWDGLTSYYVVNADTNDFEISLTSGGAAVAITSDGSGTKNVTDYGQATLADVSTQLLGRILTGTADLTGQAAGTAISTIVLTDNTKSLKIHGLSTQWK